MFMKWHYHSGMEKVIELTDDSQSFKQLSNKGEPSYDIALLGK